MTRQLTAVIEREGDGYVSLCPDLNIASQGDTVDEARSNLKEALELFFETASDAEIQQRLQNGAYATRKHTVAKTSKAPIQQRLHNEVYVTALEVAVA